MEEKTKRGAPAKMIWFLVTAGILMTVFPLVLTNGYPGRMISNMFNSAVPLMLLAMGTGLCLARGCVNLSLGGVAALSGAVFAVSAQGGAPLFAAGLIAVLTGTAAGALNGVFAVQGRRSVMLVTAVSSLFIGMLSRGITNFLSEEAVIPVHDLSSAAGIMNVLSVLVVAGLCFAGTAGAGQLFRSDEGDKPARSGGNRFLWTMLAGALAGLAGITQVIRLRAASPALFSDNELVSFIILMMAGALIPNVRGTRSESLFGFLAIVLASIAYACITVFFMVRGLDVYSQRILISVMGLLFAIPNLLICRNRRPAPETQTAGTQEEDPFEKS